MTTKKKRRRVYAAQDKISLTEQHHKKSCDINTIMAKYVKTGLIDHVAKYKGTYGDATGGDFKAAQDLVAKQKSQFNELPAEVRQMFDNDPAKYLELLVTEGGPERLMTALNPEIELEIPEIEEKPTEETSEAEG